MKRMLLLAVFAVACGVQSRGRVNLEVATQEAVNDLTVAMLSKDVKLLAQTLAPQLLAEFEAYGTERDAKLLAFIEQQEEGFVMAYGREAPKVVSIERGEYGALLVELRDHEGAYAADPNVRLKKVHFWTDDAGKVYFAGLKPGEPLPPDGVLQQAAVVNWSNFDVSNNSATTHRWLHSYITPDNLQSGCYACQNGPFGAPCAAVTQLPGPMPNYVNPFQARGFSEYANCGGPGSCAIRPIGALDDLYGCICSGTGGAYINGPAYCLNVCCFQSAFSSDFWWNSGDNNQNSQGFCHTGSCPN